MFIHTEMADVINTWHRQILLFNISWTIMKLIILLFSAQSILSISPSIWL